MVSALLVVQLPHVIGLVGHTGEFENQAVVRRQREIGMQEAVSSVVKNQYWLLVEERQPPTPRMDW